MATVGEKMTAIANAIRTKTGGTSKLTLDGMASAITSYTSDATATASTMLSGYTAYAKNAKVTGNIATKTASNLTASGATVTVPAGYYASQATKSVATATQATPSISVNSSGLITASATQTAGYVSAGTKSATKQLTTKAATTITPSTSNQTVAAGTYLTGALTIAGDADLVAANIVSGKNIFNVAGTHTCTSNVLNFTVVGGTTQPSNPAANTIWVNTSTTITSWVCDRAEPTGSNGMVWIKVGNADNSFNALKTNTITIYPLCCYQYVSGTWKKKDSKQYINGAWETWWSGEIYSYGNKYEDVTGGFKLNTAGKAYVTYNTDNIYLHILGSSNIQGGLFTNNKIDISGFSSLKMDFNFPKQTEYSQCFALCIDNENTEYYGYGDRVAWAGVPAYESGDFTVTLDVSNFSGSYYIGVQWGACSGTVYRIWLE